MFIRKVLLAFFLLLFGSGTIVFSQKKSLKVTLKAKTTIVAYDKFSSLFNVGYKTEVFFAKIDKIKKGKEKSQFMIINRAYSDEEPLINKFIDGKLNWQFALTRASYCDAKPRDYEYLKVRNEDGTRENTDTERLVFTVIKEDSNLPMNKVLPCYLLSKKFKQIQ